MQFLLTIIITALAYLAKRIKLVSLKDGETLSRIILNFTLPALVIKTFNNVKIDSSLLLVPCVSLVFGIGMAALALLVFRKSDKDLRGILSMCLPGFNVGVFAYPLVEAIWGEAGLKYFGMFDMGNALVMFGVCYMLASYFAPGDEGISYRNMLLRMAKSVPLLVYILTLVINLAGIKLPSFFIDISEVLAKGNMPLSLLLLGISLSFSFKPGSWKAILKVIVIRYAAGIAVGTALYLLMPFEPLFKYTMLLGLILPVGIAPLAYSNQFGYDYRLTGTIINITIIISFLLLWLTAGFLIA